ncbi:CoA transferase, partial [Pseudonocardia pini]|uniref:CoA transferase n=1 Tax=Pseudonocardia pini TaxID=2758030 RepID=UPI0015F119F0
MSTKPLEGIRVLERSLGQPGRVAGMLLADLGADVVRVGRGGGPVPEELVWDRGKRRTTPADDRELERLVRAADVVLDDGPSAVDGAELVARCPGLVHVALPAYGAFGRWRDLAPDPLLVTALGGFATFHPSHAPGTPVASAVPMVSSIHGALGAVLAVAGILGVRRGHGGRALEATGLHASAACLASLVVQGIDAEDMVTPDGTLGSRPSFRTYRCADDRYLHLSTLTVEFFLPALTALDRMDVMVLPGVDGEFLNTMRPDIGRVVGAELERTFAERPRDEWLAVLTEAGVPCAPVLPREEWLTSDIVAATAPPVTVAHPVLGPVVLPGTPWAFSGEVPA